MTDAFSPVWYEQSTLGNISLESFSLEEMKKEENDNVKTIRFENEEFYIPEGWEHCLVQLYGDYMKLPPVEKQVPDHSDMEIMIYE